MEVVKSLLVRRHEQAGSSTRRTRTILKRDFGYSSSSSSSNDMKHFIPKPSAHRIQKRPSLKPRERLPTKKDRLRARIPPHHSQHPQHVKRLDEELIAERVTTRLEWARESLTAFWRDGNSSSSSNSKSSSSSSQEGQRPLRYDLKMDANWWFWNLLLAASPSLLIAGYCEWVAKPEMQRQAQASSSSSSPPPPPPASSTTSMTIMDAWALLVDWWLVGRNGGAVVPEDADPTTSNNTDTSKDHNPPLPQPIIPSSSSSQQPKNNNPQLQKLQELKQQIEALESEIILMDNVRSNVPTALQQKEEPSSSSSSSTKQQLSPMQQRRMEREQAQQEASNNKDDNATNDHDDDGILPSQVSRGWNTLVHTAQSVYANSIKVLFASGSRKDNGQEQNANSQQLPKETKKP